MLAAILLGVAYFAAINGVRLLAGDPATRFLLDLALPLLAPLPLIVLCFRVAARRVERE